MTSDKEVYMPNHRISGRSQVPLEPTDTSVSRHQRPPDPRAWYDELAAVDHLLVEIAIGLQLSRTAYDKAVQRYENISQWIKRDGSPLQGRVETFYPQGSMAISATIAARGTDEFDIDVVARLALPPNTAPCEALDLLYEAVRGDSSSPYYKMTRRHTRCVTVEYRGMHIDITPAVRRLGTPDRESWIFHDRPNARYDVSKRLIANPYGFAEWFKGRTQRDDRFVSLYMARALEYEQALMAVQADTEPVPVQKPPAAKSKSAIALQLLKRWRNVQYQSRPGRCPPSIMISKMVADTVSHTNGLLEEMLVHARHLRSQFQTAHSKRMVISISNPVCERDILTDRWPRSLEVQGAFLNDLSELVAKLDLLQSGSDLAVMKTTMTELFGTNPTDRVFANYNQIIGSTVRAGGRHIRKTGSLVVPPRPTSGVKAGVAAIAGSSETRKHTFYGD